MRTVVVVPTYQEALNIEATIARIRAASPHAAILVVDDGSPDGTADLAERAGAGVLRRTAREGLGAAYRAGWARCLDEGFDVIVSMDADGSHDAAAIPSLLAVVEEGSDLAMGSRYIPGGSVPGWATHRRLLSENGNRYAALVLGLRIHDATGGFRAYRAELLRKIDLSTLRANGYGFQIELVYRAAQAGAVITEVPITFIDRQLGTSKMHAHIIWEALGLVTWWSIRDRVLHSRGRS